ncbi:MAG: hypothetical protein KC503_04725 [Myxococcales bacterium]|nr:hypothetical protein [Myxococcales bacterium]
MSERIAGVLVLVLGVVVGSAACSDSSSKTDAAARDVRADTPSAGDGLGTGDGPGSSDGPGNSDGPIATDGPAGDGATVSGLRCNGNTPFGATISAACSAPSDCIAVEHTTDCCGTNIVIGINKADKAAFDSAEAACDASWPACGCASQPTKTEDGSTVLGSAKAAATCVNGRCVSYIEGCGKPCGSGEACYGCVNGPSTTFACSTSCTMKSDCTDAAKPECASGLGAQRFCNAQATCNAP